MAEFEHAWLFKESISMMIDGRRFVISLPRSTSRARKRIYADAARALARAGNLGLRGAVHVKPTPVVRLDEGLAPYGTSVMLTVWEAESDCRPEPGYGTNFSYGNFEGPVPEARVMGDADHPPRPGW